MTRIGGNELRASLRHHRRDHAGYNTYENNQPNGYITPVIKWPHRGRGGARRGMATFTTTAAHGFRKGEKLTVSGVKQAPTRYHFTRRPGKDPLKVRVP